MMTCLHCLHCRSEKSLKEDTLIYYCVLHVPAFPNAVRCVQYGLPLPHYSRLLCDSVADLETARNKDDAPVDV